MLPFEVVDHTADLALVARGRTLSELCENAARGLFTQIADLSQERPPGERTEIRLAAAEQEELLLGWLRELLFLQETEHCVFTDFSVRVEGRYRLVGSAQRGALLADEPLTVVKAVTYHDLRIVQVHGRWEVKVVFDL
jgi:SHS2 domain-containing protein